MDGAIFDIQGTSDTFAFKAKGKASLKRSAAYAGRVGVGSALGTDQNIGKVEKALKDVPITHGNEEWNCQNWVLEGLAKLEKKELLVLDENVTHYLSEEEIREALGSQK